MTEKNKKREQIIQTAKTLFWKYGIHRVSVEEICQNAQVSKMTFYKHFNNKTDLVKTLLDLIRSESLKAYHAIMKKKISYPEKVKLLITLKLNQTEALSQEFIIDIHKNGDPEILAHFNGIKLHSVQLMLKDFLNAQKRGDVRKDLKPEFILYFLNHMFTLVEDPGLIQMYDSPQDLIMELTRFFFYGILPRDVYEKEIKE